ncbi:MAG: hypothetical protein VX278_15710 [Myxococcota bacterium]|nr:hypothetical protein [Myxococcota bacterium]
MDFGFLFSLFEGRSGNPAVAEDCASYYETIGQPTFPVFADGNGLIAGATPLIQQNPEVCALSPEMEIISCYQGHNVYRQAMEDIKTHAGL